MFKRTETAVLMKFWNAQNLRLLIKEHTEN